MFNTNKLLLLNKLKASTTGGFKPNRNVHFMSAVAGASQDAFLRTPISAVLESVTGPVVKTISMLKSFFHKAIIQQASLDSLMLLPVVGRIRGAVMGALNTAFDTNNSPVLHNVTQTIANTSDNVNNSIQRALLGAVHGDQGPYLDATAASKQAIAVAKTSYEEAKKTDLRDTALNAYIPILGTVHAILGGAKEYFIDTQLDALVSGIGGIADKSFQILKQTFSKMFLSEGKKLSVLQRIAKVPTGFLSGVADLFLSKSKSPILHLAVETAPNYLKNSVLSIARAVVGFFLGDPGEQVQVGASTLKAKGLASRTFTAVSSWGSRASGWLKNAGAVIGGGAAGAGASIAGATTAAAGALAGAAGTVAGAAKAVAANSDAIPGAAQAAAA